MEYRLVLYTKHIPMKQRLSSYPLSFTLIGVASAGVALSMALARDSQWLSWHLSRLGEGGHISAWIFNATLVLAALLLVLLAQTLYLELRRGGWNPRSVWIRRLLLTTALCWVGVAAVPFDVLPRVHQIFGYGQLLTLAVLMIGLRFINPKLSERSYLLGFANVLVIAVMLTIYFATGAVTMLVIEMVGSVLIFTWLLSVTADAQRKH